MTADSPRSVTATPLVVFIPGLGCDAALWRAQLQALKGRDAIVSDALAVADTIPAMARRVLDTAPPARPLVLCGSSMGGMVALEAALAAPERVRAIALVDSSARPDSEAAAAMRAMTTEAIAEGHFERLMRVNLPFALHRDAATDPTVSGAFMDMLLRTGPERSIVQHRAVGARRDLRGELGRIACPVLVVCGRQDRITPPEDAEELAQLLPHAELHWMERCGHLPPIERPAELDAVLLPWIARVAPVA